MATFFFEGTEVIDGTPKKRVFEVVGVSTVERAREEVAKFHPAATEVRQVQAQSEGPESINPPRIIGPAAVPAAGARVGSVAPNTIEQPPHQGPDATTPTDPNLRK